MLKGLIIKEIRHILRDPRTLLILFGLPLVMLILFGYALSTEIKNASIAVLDQAKDPESYSLQTKLYSSGYFKLEKRLQSEKELTESFKDGNTKLAIVIPPNFEQDLRHQKKVQIQIIVDATDISTGTTLSSYAQSIIRDYQQQLDPTGNQFMQVNTQVRMVFNPELKSVYSFIPGVSALVLILISAMLTSVTIAREKELGTMEVISISPLKNYHIIIGKIVPYLVLSLFNAVLIIVMGVWVFKMPMNGNILLLLLECLLYVLVALSLGVLISVKTATQQQALFSSILSLMLPTILLSGFIFPIDSMPWFLQQVSKIIPATYFIEIIKAIMIKGGGLALVWKPTLVLLGMTIVLITISVTQLKTRAS